MQSCKNITVPHKIDWDPSRVHFKVSLVEKYNMYTVHDVSQFKDFSNYYICNVELKYQSTTAKLFIDTVKITPISIKRTAAAVGSNYKHH